jgi:thiosulfate/3-mercaptopyruvate sulfurtransferase
VPGARSLPAVDNVGGEGCLLDRDELRRRFAAAGADGSRPVISYCGSGVTACHNLVLLEHLGLPEGRLYAGSWSQWSHTDRPAATGDES